MDRYRTLQPTVKSAGLFGAAVAERFHVADAGFVSNTSAKGSAIAATRLVCSKTEREDSKAPPAERAFSILLHRRKIARHELRLQGRSVYAGPCAAGAVSIVDLEEEPVARIHGPMDAIQFYLPRTKLEEYADECSAARIDRLVWARGTPDPVVSALGTLLATAIAEPAATGTLFADHVLLAALAHFTTTYGQLKPRRAEPGGLAPWQERRAREILHSRSASSLSIADVSRECGLTPSHFARGFRRSVGVAPHEYLTKVRIDRAKELMLTSELPLVDIALLCGFGDQSYFTRVFKRALGTGPGAWRRHCKA